MDRRGHKTVDFLLTARRDKATALRFFEKTIKASGVLALEPMLNFKSFRSAKNVLTGIEFMHTIRKDQLMLQGCSELFFADQFYALAGKIRPVGGIRFCAKHVHQPATRQNPLGSHR